jgi:alginate O-acetyltransferase complex protein AlgI
MLFVSSEFAVFFLVIFILFYTIKTVFGWRLAKLLLMLGSLFSYSFFYYPYLLIILFSTYIDFWCGRGISQTGDEHRKKRFVLISVFSNLSILGYFKYFNFFVDNLGDGLLLFGGMEIPFRSDMVLPIGISFYTFQSMSYTLDVYRGRCRPVESFIDFSFYVSFFTQLVAGPIVRARNFLPQLVRERTFKWTMFYWGCYLIILGLFKKLVIADNIAPYVDYFFSRSGFEDVHALTAWVYMLAYAVQIYADFSGYTDMARGMASVLGFRLPFNFYYPYIALGFRDFWRRWHISLSEWFRDYVYFSMGGSRGEQAQATFRNLMLTMFLVGLWHGASWHFVVWGLLHGAFLVIDHVALRRFIVHARDGGGLGAFASRLALRGGTFLVVVWAWVFFRAQSLDQAWDITTAMFTHFQGYEIAETYLHMGQYWGIVYVMHLFVLARLGDRLHRRFTNAVYFPSAVAMVVLLFFNRAVDTNAFIYFQF